MPLKAKGMAALSSIACLRQSLGQKSLVGHSPKGCKRDGLNLATKTVREQITFTVIYGFC